MLVRCLKRIRSGEGDIYLANLQAEVRCVLRLTRLDRVFECFADVALAVQRFVS
jgi:anti-anti-sigma regulatory factor